MKYLSLDKNSEQKVAYQHEIKQSNLKQAFDLIRSGACTSRSELAREMGLSATAVSSLTDELMQHGLVLESGVIHADTPGRRPISLKINESAKQIAVFSLDSAYMHFTLYNIGLNAIEEISLPYAGLISRGENRGEEYAAMFEDIILNKSRKIVREKLIAVCISFPGIYLSHEEFFTARSSLDAVIKSDTLKNFTRNVGAPAFIANRSMCMAYAEKKLLEAHHEASNEMAFVNISDYVGSAIINNGNIYTGSNDTAGDIAHIRAGSEGRPCPCGGEDCLHTYLSLNSILKDVQAACRAENLPCPEDFDAVAAEYGSNPAVDRAITAAANRFADALAVLIYTSSTDRIVVSGDIRKLGGRFLETISARLNRLIYARHHSISYALSAEDSDRIGIVQYLLDKTDEIIANNYSYNL